MPGAAAGIHGSNTVRSCNSIVFKEMFVPVLVENILHPAAVEASDARTFPLSVLINTPGAESNPLYHILTMLFLLLKG